MDYQQPFGTAAGTAYTNGNPGIGLAGSIPPAGAFEYPQRELVNLITKSALTASNSDLSQAARSVQRLRVSWAGTFSGTANALACTLDPAPGALADILGAPIRGIIASTNTTAATLTVNGLTGNIKLPGGTSLTGGELTAGRLVLFAWDGTQFQILSGSGGNVINWNQPLPGFFAARAADSTFTTLVASTWTKVALGTIVTDTQGWFNNSTSRFTPQKPGYYFITIGGSAGSNSTSPPAFAVRFFKNGDVATDADPNTCIWGSQFAGFNNGNVSVGTGVMYFNGTGDFAELYGFQDQVDSAGFRRVAKARAQGFFLGV